MRSVRASGSEGWSHRILSGGVGTPAPPVLRRLNADLEQKVHAAVEVAVVLGGLTGQGLGALG